MQMCQDATDSDFEYILGKYTDFSWEVTNTDSDNLQFEIHYGGGDEVGGVARYIATRIENAGI